MATAAERLIRQVKPELEAAIEANDRETSIAHLGAAIEILKKAAPKRPAKRLDLPGKSRKTRREERKERAAQIRALVMERADGHCEWCGREGFVLEWAHVIDGSDKQFREDVDTTAAACADCHHRGWHGSGPRRMKTLRDAKEWAIRYGFRDALAEIERKIAKATPSVPVRLEVSR